LEDHTKPVWNDPIQQFKLGKWVSVVCKIEKSVNKYELQVYSKPTHVNYLTQKKLVIVNPLIENLSSWLDKFWLVMMHLGSWILLHSEP